MELLRRPRHQLRAQGRRRDQAGVVFVKHERRARWRPGQTGSAVAEARVEAGGVAVLTRPTTTNQSQQDDVLLDFLARTAVDSEKELLHEYVSPPSSMPQSVDAFARFKRSLESVHSNERASFRQNHGDLDVALEESPSTDWATTFEPIEPSYISDSPEDWGCEAGESSDALKTLLGALNDWLSAGKSDGANGKTQSSPTENVEITIEETTASPSQSPPSSLNSFSLDNWRNPLDAESTNAPPVVSIKGPSLLSALQDAASQAQVRVKTLPQGRRLECHENGAVLEKNEFGRVTQVRTRTGEILSVYYGQDGAAEGFVRTDSRGRLHSVGDVDANGVTVRDNVGRLRAVGESLSIDSNGKLSICRSDGQYWSLDLLRHMMVEKRKLCSEEGNWTSMTALFAGDGFRMMTLFQDLPDQAANHKDEQRTARPDAFDSFLSKLGPEGGRFRFYGRDGSMIEFSSEQELAKMLPTHVSGPGVHRVEPRWHSKPQAGTAWNAVQEFLLVDQPA